MKLLRIFIVSLIVLTASFLILNRNIPTEKSTVNEPVVITSAERADNTLPLPDITSSTDVKTKPKETNKTICEKHEENDIIPTETSNSESAEIENVLECTLSVKCTSVLSNISKPDKAKLEILPSDGIIFPETKVVFYDGESAFNILAREMKKHKIHLDFESTPMYNTVYIKGISNLYEHDCGELSGWLYMINGKVPEYGCSQYILKSGDKVEFVYTCDLGADVGSNFKR